MISQTKHWAYQFAEQIKKAKKTFVINTGITPSGEIHIGNMREVLTGDAIYRALCDLEEKPEFNYIADDYDPLRKVYPFLDKSYEAHIGKPLCDIPCPCGNHKSYSEHFLEPFLESLKKLDIRANTLRTNELYRSGKFNKVIILAIKNKDKIKEILNKLTGREFPDDWSPFNVLCSDCGKMTDARLEDLDEKNETMKYSCKCGSKKDVEIKDAGKLVWRVDWAAKWAALNVSIEPFGKDHASRGGSYDTGKIICKDIFGWEPPFPIIYEWISLKGKGDMSSSKGNVVSIHKMLEIVPPEVLRYLVMRAQPKKAIGFDPVLPLVSLIDEYDDPESKNRNEEAYKLAEIRGIPPVGIPFKHMVNIVQIANDDLKIIKEVAKRTGYDVSNETGIKDRAKYARKWLENYAPDEMKFNLQDSLTEKVSDLTENQKKALKEIADNIKENMKAEDIHQLVYETKEKLGLTPQEIFKAIYIALLAQEKGPRAGWFLASLDAEFVKKRFKEASE